MKKILLSSVSFMAIVIFLGAGGQIGGGPLSGGGSSSPICAVGTNGICQPDGTTITVTAGGILSAAAGAVSSVFTRTGAVVATTGDYTVAQVTGAAPLASPTFTGTAIIPTLNVTTYQKGGQGVHTVNACQAAVSPTPVSGTNVYTCNIIGGSTGSVCWAVPTNAAAQLLWGGTGGVVAPLSGNVPRAVVLSGTTLTITFDTRTNVQPVAGGETFTAACTL